MLTKDEAVEYFKGKRINCNHGYRHICKDCRKDIIALLKQSPVEQDDLIKYVQCRSCELPYAVGEYDDNCPHNRLPDKKTKPAKQGREIVAINTTKVELYFPKDKEVKLCKEDRLIRTVAFNDNSIWANLSGTSNWEKLPPIPQGDDNG